MPGFQDVNLKPRRLQILDSKVKLQSDAGKTEAKVDFSPDFTVSLGARPMNFTIGLGGGHGVELKAKSLAERDRAVITLRHFSKAVAGSPRSKGFFG